ncbi:MAG: hypothetical protein RL754_195 [Bacteroidota bacterium]|jgi:hypothetical protein
MTGPRNIIGIGGLGGSGTRLLAQFLQEQGLNMPTPRNESDDCLHFTRLFKWPDLLGVPREIQIRWNLFNRLITGRSLGLARFKAVKLFTQQPFEPISRKESVALLKSRTTVEAPVLFKEPNLHLFAKDLLELDPGLKFIYLMRDGLKMAYNSNQQQLNNFGDAVLADAPPTEDLVLRALQFWDRSNERAAELVGRYPDRAMMVRYEDLIQDPEQTIGAICSFLELPYRSITTDIRQARTKIPAEVKNEHYQVILDRWGY